MKKNLLIFLLCFWGGISLQAQSISTVVPSQNPIPEGGNLTVQISGNNTHFAQGSSTYISATIGNFSTYGYIIGSPSNTSMNVQFYLPCGACGAANITVSNSIDGQMSYSNAFTVNCAQLNAIHPDTANAGQVLQVSLSGTGVDFSQGSAIVYFQSPSTGEYLYPTSYNTVTTDSIDVTLTIPNNACNADYNVCVYAGASCPVCLFDAFHVVGYNGQITAVNPGIINAGQTLPIGISGTGMNFTQGSLSVYFRNSSTGQTLYPFSSNVISADSMNVTLSVPNTVCYGIYDVCAYFGSGGYCPTCLPSGLVINGMTSSPQVDSVSPDTAIGGQPLTVSISGTDIDFQQGSSFYFQLSNNSGWANVGTYYSSPDPSDPTKTTVYFSNMPNVCGSYDLSIYGADPCGGSIVTYTNAVSVTATLDPVINSVYPNIASTGQTFNLSMYVSEFDFVQNSTSVSARLIHRATGNVLTGTNLVAYPFNTSFGTVDFSSSMSDCGWYDLELAAVPTGCGDVTTIVYANAVNITNPTSPHLQSILPNHGIWEQTVVSTITAANVDFNTVSLADVYLYNTANNSYIYATNITPNPSNSNEAYVTFVIPSITSGGLDYYDVIIDNIVNCGSTQLVLPNGFEVYIPVGITDPDNSSFEVKIYPNPMDNQATLEIIDGEDQPMVFNLYDVLGKKVQSKTLKGNTTVTIEREGLSSGVYLYRLSDIEGNALHIGKLELR